MFQGVDIATAQVHRFNAEAAKLLDDPASRMFAVQGDLTDPHDFLSQPEWWDFDVAIISMALHHVKDPVGMLKFMKERVRKGGSIVVLDFLQHDNVESGDGRLQDLHNHSKMIELTKGPKIWPGFSLEPLKAGMVDSGLGQVEVKICDEPIFVPDEMPGYREMFLAKGMVL